MELTVHNVQVGLRLTGGLPADKPTRQTMGLRLAQRAHARLTSLPKELATPQLFGCARLLRMIIVVHTGAKPESLGRLKCSTHHSGV